MTERRPKNLEDVFTPENIKHLSSFLTAEATSRAQDALDTFLGQYEEIAPELESLAQSIHHEMERMKRRVQDTSYRFNPHQDSLDSRLVDLDDFKVIKVIQLMGANLQDYLWNSYKRLREVDSLYYGIIAKVVKVDDVKAYHVRHAVEAISTITKLCVEELQQTVAGFQELLAETYLGARKEYKNLRRKYLAQEDKGGEDDMETQFFTMIFGQKPRKEEHLPGPAIALVDGNCVLTETLSNAIGALPKRYEKNVRSRGEPKVVKQLDEGEVEKFADSLAHLAHPVYMNYLREPNSLWREVGDSLQNFYDCYAVIGGHVRNLVVKMLASGSMEAPGIENLLEKQFTNPKPVVQKLQKMNFLAIQPLEEDTAPRTKMEKDYANARMKLLTHMHATITTLSDMRGEGKEEYAVARVREAIRLNEALEEITKTEHQRRLRGDIRDENEFYVGKTGQHGALEIERAPAPKVDYKNIKGASFDGAKQHLEEVVKVASYAHLMRISAPRGNVKSNLMLIGPYGCGKSEFGRGVCADPRVITINVTGSTILTAYMHESVKNVKRMYDHAEDLRRQSRHTKSVGIVIDEFDRVFTYGQGVHAAYDGARMEGEFQAMMDGVVGYEGVFMLAMTNKPGNIPKAIMRRFKFIDVVGQLTEDDRTDLLKFFLNRGLPIADDVAEEHYRSWARQCADAPGDVMGKIADEVHFKFMHDYMLSHPKEAVRLERVLAGRAKDNGYSPRDYAYIKGELAKFRRISAEDISGALEYELRQPQIQLLINEAREVYRDAEDILNGLATVSDDGGMGFGAKRKTKLWQP